MTELYNTIQYTPNRDDGLEEINKMLAVLLCRKEEIETVCE